MEQPHAFKITLLKGIMAFMAGGMTVLIVLTSLKSNMFQLSPVVLQEPWFQTTLVDFYFNIVILSCWVIYREGHWGRSLSWILAFICLGSVATALYVLIQLLNLRPGDGIDKILLKKTNR